MELKEVLGRVLGERFMKKLLLTILLNVLLLLPVVGWGGVHGCIRYEDGRSGEAVGLEIGASEGLN